MTEQLRNKPLTQDEIDEVVIAQTDDDEAWEEEIFVTPVSRRRVAREAGLPPNHPSGHRHS